MKKAQCMSIFILMIVMFFSFSCTSQQNKVSRTEFISIGLENMKTGNHQKKYSRNEVNRILHLRGGDTLYSLFPTQEYLATAYYASPHIRIYDRSGRLTVSFCSDHFPDVENHMIGLHLEDGITNDLLLDFVRSNYLNADEVFNRLPSEFRFLVFVPWSVRDTITIEEYSLNPFEDWFKITQRAVKNLSPDFVILYESKMRLQDHDWSNEEVLSAEYDLIRSLFPDHYE